MLECVSRALMFVLALCWNAHVSMLDNYDNIFLLLLPTSSIQLCTQLGKGVEGWGGGGGEGRASLSDRVHVAI